MVLTTSWITYICQPLARTTKLALISMCCGGFFICFGGVFFFFVFTTLTILETKVNTDFYVFNTVLSSVFKLSCVVLDCLIVQCNSCCLQVEINKTLELYVFTGLKKEMLQKALQSCTVILSGSSPAGLSSGRGVDILILRLMSYSLNA